MIFKNGALILVPLLFLSLAGCGDETVQYQGYVEGDFLLVGAQEGGRVMRLAVREGDVVEAGDLLFSLDDTAAAADVAEARNTLTAAEARLADAKIGARQPEIEALLARKEQAEANLELSRIQLNRARRLVESGTRAQENLDEAETAYERDAAALAEINKDIEVAQLGARINQIEAAAQEVEAAKARLQKAEWRLDERHVKAPVAGQINEIIVREGEVVTAGAPVVILLPPENVKVRFYMPQAAMPAMTQGTSVLISCDGCPTPVEARITFIANEVEFTPPVIYSVESRDKLMIMAEARPLTPVAFLRPGQPVTVIPVSDVRTGD